MSRLWGVVMVTEEVWKKFLEIISSETNPVSFATWFANIKLLEATDEKIAIEVPMTIHKNMLGDNYYNLIEDTFNKLTGKTFDIEFYLEGEFKKNSVQNIIENTIDDVITSNSVQETFVSNLQPNLNFDNFVVGDTNRFAKTAALAVAESPGKIYNPLFIYGKSGLGKTHLMHAIGNYISQHSNLKVLYTTSDDFRNDFTGIANLNDYENSLDYANNFKNKYRNVDVLIIDDIQYLVGAEKTQQEFFHTFNELHRNNKQIIISSDRSPEDLKLLQERLRSRFTWGLPVDIFPPDFNLRCLILKDKMKNFSWADKVSEEAIEYIASNCDGDVRALEGTLNRLAAMIAMNVPSKITLELAIDYLKDYLSKNIYTNNQISSVQKAVADYYNLTVDILKSKKRSANIAYPRQIAMYLCRLLTDESFPRIGLEFGNRDHSTVIHACDKIESDLKDNKQLQEIINEIKEKL